LAAIGTGYEHHSGEQGEKVAVVVHVVKYVAARRYLPARPSFSCGRMGSVP
jgi:hypothetical protein